MQSLLKYSMQIREKRMALGEAFGSKKSKAAIQSELSSQVDTKALESVASQIFENVKAATEHMPSQGRSVSILLTLEMPW